MGEVFHISPLIDWAFAFCYDYLESDVLFTIGGEKMAAGAQARFLSLLSC